MSSPSPSLDLSAGPRLRVLWTSTIAFTLLFSVWLMLGVLGTPIRKEFKLTDPQYEWLIATAILSGALFRLNFGIWADRFGGRVVMLTLLFFTAIPSYCLSRASTYNELLVCALFYGLAGNSFTAGIAWVSAWFPASSKGTALGVFGAGNVGAAGTKLLLLLVPGILTLVPEGGYLNGIVPGGWRVIPALYAVLLVLMGVAVMLITPAVDRKPGAGRKLADLLAPLRFIQVWRFSLYYVIVFGAYVALSAWLPKYFIDTYGLTLRTAAILTALLFIFPASLLRPLGGYLSDRYGPRVVTYSILITMSIALVFLSIPNGTYVLDSVRAAGGEPFTLSYRLDVVSFTAILFVVGCAMGIGKASVYKYIPNYYPGDVGAVGGLVGMLGALGGFVLPPVFGMLSRWAGFPQMAFVALLVLALGSLCWLHAAVLWFRQQERRSALVLEHPLQVPYQPAMPALQPMDS